MKNNWDLLEKSSWTKRLLCGANIICLLYLVALSCFNVPSCDDWIFAFQLRESGFFRFIYNMYMEWQGRYGSFFMTGLLLKTYELSGSLMLFTLLLCSLGIGSLYLLSKIIFLSLNVYSRLLIACSVFNLFVLGTYQFNTFFWICGSSYFSIVFITCILLYLIWNNRYDFLTYAGMFFCSFLVGGGAEHYTAIVIMFLGIYLIYKFYTVQFSFGKMIHDPLLVKVMVSTMLLCLFFMVMLIAPGNTVRMNCFEHPASVLELLKFSIIPYAKFWVYLLPKLFYALLIVPLFYFIGGYYKLKGIEVKNHASAKNLFLACLGFMFFLWICILPGVYAIGQLMPVRALTYFSLVTISFAAYWGFQFGYKNAAARTIYINLASVVIICMALLFTIVEVPMCARYKESIDFRMEKLQALKNEKFEGVAELEPLFYPRYTTPTVLLFNASVQFVKPHDSPVIFYSPLFINELSEDINHFTNQGVKKYFELGFDIRLKE